MNKKQETVATYNATATEMAKKFCMLGARVEDIERGFRLVGKNNPHVLEIGCGNGRDAKEITRRTNQYLGIDISKLMITLANKHAPNGNFKIADIEDYLFPENLDLIFSFASLLHSDKENVQKILKRAHNALNSGGIFYISLKHDEYHEESRTDEFGTRTFYFYTPELIKELVGNMFTVVYEEKQELQHQKWFTIALRKS